MSLYEFLHLACAGGAMAMTLKLTNGAVINIVVGLVCLLLGPMALAVCLFGRLAAINERQPQKTGVRK